MTSENVDFESQNLANYWREESQVCELVCMSHVERAHSAAVYRALVHAENNDDDLQSTIQKVIGSQQISLDLKEALLFLETPLDTEESEAEVAENMVTLSDEHILTGEIDSRSIMDGSVRYLLNVLSDQPPDTIIGEARAMLKENHMDGNYDRVELALAFARHGRVDLSEKLSTKEVISDPFALDIAKLGQALGLAAGGDLRAPYFKLQEIKNSLLRDKGLVEIQVLFRAFSKTEDSAEDAT